MIIGKLGSIKPSGKGTFVNSDNSRISGESLPLENRISFRESSSASNPFSVKSMPLGSSQE